MLLTHFQNYDHLIQTVVESLQSRPDATPSTVDALRALAPRLRRSLSLDLPCVLTIRNEQIGQLTGYLIQHGVTRSELLKGLAVAGITIQGRDTDSPYARLVRRLVIHQSSTDADRVNKASLDCILNDADKRSADLDALIHYNVFERAKWRTPLPSRTEANETTITDMILGSKTRCIATIQQTRDILDYVRLYGPDDCFDRKLLIGRGYYPGEIRRIATVMLSLPCVGTEIDVDLIRANLPKTHF